MFQKTLHTFKILSFTKVNKGFEIIHTDVNQVSTVY